jgi:hypothetical protein
VYEHYIGKKVKIVLNEPSSVFGKCISGQAVDYLYADEDEQQEEGEILIEGKQGLIAVRESEIKSISEMN